MVAPPAVQTPSSAPAATRWRRPPLRRCRRTTASRSSTRHSRRCAVGEIERLVASPPSYVTGLRGPEPLDRAKALRWRQGLTEIEDWRRQRGTLAAGQGDPYEAAFGPPLSGRAGRRQRRLAARTHSLRASFETATAEGSSLCLADDARSRARTAPYRRTRWSGRPRRARRQGQRGGSADGGHARQQRSRASRPSRHCRRTGSPRVRRSRRAARATAGSERRCRVPRRVASNG